MFGRISRRYDLANRLLSGGTDIWWRSRLVAAVRRWAPQDVLDLATGSGDVAFALARGLPPMVAITGLDFSAPMLDEALRKQKEAGDQYTNIHFGLGDILKLPVPDDSFDAVTISFGLRNLADRDQGLREMRRVLRPGGRLYVLEFSQPHAWFRPIYLFYLRKILPAIAGKVTGDRAAYEYLNETIEQFPGRAALAAEICAAGFTDVRAKAMTFCVVALHEAVK